jgi:hypothetical protein
VNSVRVVPNIRRRAFWGNPFELPARLAGVLCRWFFVLNLAVGMQTMEKR